MSDEQRVRTMCEWVGVEISKCRVRTPGKAGYGLYRVRSAAERHWHVPHPKVGPDGEWTPYAFTLDQVHLAVAGAIQEGTPSAPGALRLPRATGDDRSVLYTVPTRWTQAYRGRRDLGAPVGEGLSSDAIGVLGGGTLTSTGRQRQREQNAEFQEAHLERRAYGLQQRHAAKLERNRNASG